MDRKTAVCILNAQEKLQSDSLIMCEYEKAHRAFIEMLPGLTDTQQNILMDYLGICVELHLRMLEEAVEMK